MVAAMAVRPYSPKNSPKTPLRSEKVGVVLLNHGGSIVDSDTGRDADYYADQLGVHVIAADRPGTATWPGQGRRLATGYIGAMGRLAEKQIMPEVEKLKLSSIVVAGRSAGGLAALVMATTEQLPVAAVHAQEPVGWRSVSIHDGKAMVDEYRHSQRTMLETPELGLVRPKPTDQVGLKGRWRAVQNAYNGPVDRWNNARVWARPLALMSAIAIAADHPGIGLDIRFAEYSMVIDDDDVQGLEPMLRRVRGATKVEGPREPVNVRVQPNTVHASFDLRSFSAWLLAETVERYIEPPIPA